MAFLAAPKSPLLQSDLEGSPVPPLDMYKLHATAECQPEDLPMMAPRGLAPRDLAAAPSVDAAAAAGGGGGGFNGGLGPAPSVVEDHSRCGRECSLLHGQKPMDPLYREMIGPALRNESLRFKEYVDNRIASLRGPVAAADGNTYRRISSLTPPPPRTTADYQRQSHTIVHYLKTCGRFDQVEAADVSLLEDPEYPDAVFYIHLRDPLDDNTEHNIYFFPNKTFVGADNEFLRTVCQTWLDGCKVDVGGGFMDVRYSVYPV